jgi:CBS domain-containing protein
MNAIAQPTEEALRTPAPSLRELRVGDVMHRGVLTCTREAPLIEVAELMAGHRVHCVVVEDASALEGEDVSLWGVVSDMDLVAAAFVRDLEGQAAGGSAATPVVMVRADETVERAAQLMTEHATAHLVVVDSDGARPVGVLSTLDVAGALAGAGTVHPYAAGTWAQAPQTS